MTTWLVGSVLWVWAGLTYAFMTMLMPRETRHPLQIIYFALFAWWLVVPVTLWFIINDPTKKRFPL